MRGIYMLLTASVFALLPSVASYCGSGDQAADGAKSAPRQNAPMTCNLVSRQIKVDGDPSDWRGIAANVVRGKDHLWFGQGMTPEQWHGNDDLSYRWKGAWSAGELYFLFEVYDNRLVKAAQDSSYLCDCVEIYLDYGNRGGSRVKIQDGRDDWFAKCDRRELMGYELHFLPTEPPLVYLDHTHKYATRQPQTGEFTDQWRGQAVAKATSNGYVLEIGFSVPGVELAANKILGIEIGVCDDDGDGRKAIMMWTGTKGDFWITMDGYGKVKLVD